LEGFIPEEFGEFCALPSLNRLLRLAVGLCALARRLAYLGFCIELVDAVVTRGDQVF
jgi:hypothetical protein